MFSLFKRNSQPAAEATFKERVQRFWEWYSQAASRFYDVVEAGKCSILAEEVSQKVDKLGPGFAWVFGPGENSTGHSFTLSGEGNPHLQLLSIYWLSQAPTINGWTFYAARQPGSISGQSLQLGGRSFDPLEFWITPTVNAEDEKIDIAVWHPRFDSMAEKERWTVLFLFLDEVLGEYGTQQWIGEITFDPKRLADSFPLEELREFTLRTQSETGWKKGAPGESGLVYRLPDQHDRFLRGDIVVGSTMHPRLINEYLNCEGELENPLKGTGADFVFVRFDAGLLPKGDEAGARGRIEDSLDLALKESASGRLLGGAWGPASAYIDLLLFDEARSIEIVLNTLRQNHVPPGSSVNYFAREKRGFRVLV